MNIRSRVHTIVTRTPAHLCIFMTSIIFLCTLSRLDGDEGCAAVSESARDKTHRQMRLRFGGVVSHRIVSNERRREKPATSALIVCTTECRVLGSMNHRSLAHSAGHQHARPRQRRTRAVVTVHHVCLYSKRGRSLGRAHDAEGAQADVLFISASTRNLRKDILHDFTSPFLRHIHGSLLLRPDDMLMTRINCNRFTKHCHCGQPHPLSSCDDLSDSLIDLRQKAIVSVLSSLVMTHTS